MTPNQATSQTLDSLWLALQLAGPLLAVCLVVALLVSIFQAATQLADSTLSFIPKLLAATITGALLFPWMFQRLADYARLLIESIPRG